MIDKYVYKDIFVCNAGLCDEGVVYDEERTIHLIYSAVTWYYLCNTDTKIHKDQK